MIVKVSPSKISGRVVSPSSKSSMQRAVAAALLANGTSTLFNPSYADDSNAAIEMAQCLGAVIERSDSALIIKGGLNPVCNTLNCGESGLGFRLFSAISSLCKNEITLTGSGTLVYRPMEMVSSTLRSMGVKVESDSDRLPFVIRGPIRSGVANVDGTVSSQFLTGLLMALPTVEGDSHLIVDSLKSKPYIDLTIDVLKAFGIEIDNRNYKEIFIKGGQIYKSTDYRVEEDWSGIAFLAVLGAISGKITIENISSRSVQADRMIVDILKDAGADLIFDSNAVTVRSGELRPFRVDITDCPDLAPPLVVLAAFCNGVSELTGTTRLAAKESNRSATLKKEFSKLGVPVILKDDSIEIEGGRRISGGVVSSHGDHRIAMALSIAASRASSHIIIEGAESVNKSYPQFFNDLIKVNGDIEIMKQ